MFCEKKVFLKISQYSQENTCARVSFLIRLQALGLQVFSRCFPVNFAKFLRTPFLQNNSKRLLLSLLLLLFIMLYFYVFIFKVIFQINFTKIYSGSIIRVFLRAKSIYYNIFKIHLYHYQLNFMLISARFLPFSIW